MSKRKISSERKSKEVHLPSAKFLYTYAKELRYAKREELKQERKLCNQNNLQL